MTSDVIHCTAYQPWYVPCSDILPSMEMKVLSAVISLLIIVLNTASSLLHLLTANKTFSVTVASINFSEFLCGAYLSCLWIVDLSFKGTFMVKGKWWKSSNLCFGALATILLYAILNPLLLLFLALSRFMVVIFPTDTKFRQLQFLFKALACAFIICFIIVLLFSLIFKFTNSFLTTALCLPFIDPTGKIVVIKVIAWFTATFQIIISIAITFLYIFLVLKLRKTEKNIEKSKAHHNSKFGLVTQLALTCLTIMICWFPANFIFITAMFIATYPLELIIWTVLLVLPVNSIINSCIFINTCLRKCIQSRDKIFLLKGEGDLV